MSKKKQENFDTYRSRMKKVKEVTIKEARAVLLQVQDAYSWLTIKNMNDEAEIASLLVDRLKNYDHNLCEKDITLVQINRTNKKIDEQVVLLHKAVVGREKVLEKTLAQGIEERIKEQGYAYLFDEDKMETFQREEVAAHKAAMQRKSEAARVERLRNENKAISAMFGSYTESEIQELRAAISGEEAE